MVVAAASPSAWNKERERVRRWRSKRSAAGRDIGELPPVADPHRKRAARFSLRLFCETYFPHTFDKPWSPDHLKVIAAIEAAVLHGGLFALAMPRGSGKTTLCEAAALWSVLFGFHRYVVIVGATNTKARELLDSIKTEIRTNDLLAADFPEACFPVRALEGINNRASGQRYRGQPTFIRWGLAKIVLPTIPGSPASGAILEAAGITSEGLRGKKHKTPDGENLRPTLCIPDDPQTDKSARNPGQCQKREDIISGTILGMAGPGQRIAAVCPCTVIEENDLADRLLDRSKYPEWNGIRTKTLYSFPDALETLWAEYAELRAAGMRAGDNGAAATEFYRQHRQAMDAGAVVAWPERHRDDELSGLQHAMNKFFRDRYAFAAEDQNEPIQRAGAYQVKILSADEIAHKLNRCPRREIPLECSTVTAFIDVSQDVLWWFVTAWDADFGGGIVDYGTWPDQGRAYFTLTDLKRTIADELPHIADLEGQIFEALNQCTADLLGREYTRGDGSELRTARLLIDANWQTATVKRFCRQSPFAALIYPSHGRGIGAKNRPIAQWQTKAGERKGDEWVIARAAEARGVRHVTLNTNHWKSFVHARLSTPAGGRGSLALFGDKPAAHRMLADHLVAEKPTRVSANGREVDEFILPPHKPDNHWLDGLVGTAVAASIEGLQIEPHRDTRPAAPRRPRTVHYPDAPGQAAPSNPLPEAANPTRARRRRTVRYQDA